MHDKLKKLYGALYLGMGVFSFAYIGAFAVWGYAAVAAGLPWAIAVVAVLFANAVACALTAPRGDRRVEWLGIILPTIILLMYVGNYLHPNNKLHTAINASAAATSTDAG